MREKGGNAYQNSAFHDIVSAFIAMVSGSLSQEQYLLHFALTRDAKRSIVGVPKASKMSWKATFESSHSVSGLDNLEPSSAGFSLDATYSAKIQRSRSMHHSHILLVMRCRSWCLVPPILFTWARAVTLSIRNSTCLLRVFFAKHLRAKNAAKISK